MIYPSTKEYKKLNTTTPLSIDIGLNTNKLNKNSAFWK
ncbi:hypothetical protein MNB_SV-6-1587 [hydrothermal vent metagenome]|uniref:Uncharacterized protein n=1 Tax=hydrothermal vent metagenome TaxID=652676 RepID=A0A1W1C3F0_9ZZZZ